MALVDLLEFRTDPPRASRVMIALLNRTNISYNDLQTAKVFFDLAFGFARFASIGQALQGKMHHVYQ